MERRIQEATAKEVCPQCGKPVAKGTGYGPGQHEAGYFCGIDCYAEFYKEQIIEQHRGSQPSPNGQ